jgi:hydroxymethylbilane synthase
MPACIASSSPRRRAQLAAIYPDAKWTTIRGNVGTRLRKLTEGEADASLLAAAGLDRLAISGYEGLDFIELPIETSVPAPGQAAIAIQCRAADCEKYQDLFCEQTKLAVTFERRFLHQLGGGCQTPVGAHFDGHVFYIFHPKVGFTTYEFELKEISDIEAILPTILDDLDLEQVDHSGLK